MPNMKANKSKPMIKAITYGEPKTGKSTFASTFPTPAFLIMTEPDASQYAGKDIEYIQINANDPNAFEQLSEIIDQLQDKMFGDEPFPYESVIVDSLTEISAIFEAQILRVNRREFDPFKTPKKAYNDKDSGMRIQDWGVFKNMHERFVRNIHALPCHTCMVAHEVIKESGDNKALKGCLSISGNFGETGTKLFNTVLRSRAKTSGQNTRYFMQTKPAMMFTAGLWGTSLPLEWENASYKELIKAFA